VQVLERHCVKGVPSVFKSISKSGVLGVFPCHNVTIAPALNVQPIETMCAAAVTYVMETYGGVSGALALKWCTMYAENSAASYDNTERYVQKTQRRNLLRHARMWKDMFYSPSAARDALAGAASQHDVHVALMAFFKSCVDTAETLQREFMSAPILQQSKKHAKACDALEQSVSGVRLCLERIARTSLDRSANRGFRADGMSLPACVA
jgi:hypothetical protein